jgi:DNA-binding CsgD family transcriptional regulator
MDRMVAASSARLHADLVRLAHRGAGVREYSLRAARVLARAVPFDGLCVLTMDPATLLPTGEVVENGLPPAAIARLTEIEMGEADFNAFGALARSAPHTASLSHATGGKLDRSPRHREVKARYGFGDELRAALVTGSSTWGGLTLLRAKDRAHFTPTEVGLVASVSPRMADGLRRALLLTADRTPRRDDEPVPGFAVLAPDNTIALADAAAERWLAELADGKPDGMPPRVVTAVAGRARSIVGGRAAATVPTARARVRTCSGQWLLLRASTLGDGPEAQTTVILEPAGPHELAPLIADAYELTERERAVTALVAQGLATSAIAARLHLSPWTVQDHLKTIFDKVGARSRGELVARLFFEHHAPRLAEGAPLGTDGWFAGSPDTEPGPRLTGRAPRRG